MLKKYKKPVLTIDFLEVTNVMVTSVNKDNVDFLDGSGDWLDL